MLYSSLRSLQVVYYGLEELDLIDTAPACPVLYSTENRVAPSVQYSADHSCLVAVIQCCLI
jgi:hypothetical protein